MEKDMWRQKAVERRWEIKELDKRRKELKISREKWKIKYLGEKRRAEALSRELKAIKKN